MASIAIMISGAIINAAAFTDGNYLAQYLSGSGKAALAEKMRHDKALEKYQEDMANYRRSRTSRTLITRSSSTTRRTQIIN